jgi:CRP/FNR family transcriptional regulator, polysaccharide utilization system transcription regulator
MTKATNMKTESFHCAVCKAHAHSMLQYCSDEAIEKINLLKFCNHYKKGQLLFFEGNKPLGLFCISNGAIKIYKTGIEGKEQIVRFAQAGDFLGYRALIAEEPYSASGEALEDTNACFIPSDIFYDILAREADFTKQMMKTLCQELGIAREQLMNMSQKSVRERMAETLLILLDCFRHEVGQEDLIPVKLPREDIANLAGTSTETAIRLLTEFKEEGYLENVGKHIRILNRSALMRTARVLA